MAPSMREAPGRSPRKGRSRSEDLHGFDVATALDFAMQRVAEAYDNGYQEIEFTHGAADVAAKPQSGRGLIKWELRALLESGAMDRWADQGRSWARSSSLLVALKPNPRPRPERWHAAPERRHRI